MRETKNDVAWKELFTKYNIIQNISSNGSFIIKSSDINEFREARLMTKFDYKSQLPTLFAQNNLSILPISRGSYVIAQIDTFAQFDKNDVEIKKIDFPHYLESIDYNNISTESTALNCAYVTGIIEDFTGDELVKPTVSGRMSSQSFNFNINRGNSYLNVDVRNSQIEIDGGYEGVNSLSLIEAKNSISDDFLIRQLYYPYRLWSSKINKKVRSLFLTYTNGIFHFREYDFEDPNNYNSLILLRQKKYVIREGAINLETIQKALGEVPIFSEPEVPFPQADSFERVVNLCELLHENKDLTAEQITDNYDFDPRQADYYANAGRYLGIIGKNRDNGQTYYFLTRKGKSLFDLSITDRQIDFLRIILSRKAFNETLKLYLKKGDVPSKNEIVAIMKKANLYNIGSDVTYRRRASTVLGWINWIMDLIEE